MERKKKYVAMIKPLFLRDTQLYTGKDAGVPLDAEDDWSDVSMPAYLGIYTAESEYDLTCKLSRQEGVLEDAIHLIEV